MYSCGAKFLAPGEYTGGKSASRAEAAAIVFDGTQLQTSRVKYQNPQKIGFETAPKPLGLFDRGLMLYQAFPVECSGTRIKGFQSIGSVDNEHRPLLPACGVILTGVNLAVAIVSWIVQVNPPANANEARRRIFIRFKVGCCGIDHKAVTDRGCVVHDLGQDLMSLHSC